MFFEKIFVYSVLSLVYCDREIHDFINLPDDLQANFDTFNIVSREEVKSDWCKDVTEVEEIRDVNGEHYRKMYLIDREVDQRILVDKNSGGELYLSKRPILNCFDQTDERLIHSVKKMIIEPEESEEYNLTTSLEDFYKSLEECTVDLSLEMEDIFFKDVTNGFFIEAGAAEGERDSHTLLLESKYNWTGLLVEPFVNGLLFKKRKAKVVQTCLALEPRPHYAELDSSSVTLESGKNAMAGVVKEKTSSSISYQCIPLYSMLAAVGNPTVNWFILDIEGAEFQVLKTIPWEIVDIEMISVETNLAGLVWEGSRRDIIEYMKTIGYIHRVHSSLSDKTDEVRDDLFIREDVAKRYRFNLEKRDEL